MLIATGSSAPGMDGGERVTNVTNLLLSDSGEVAFGMFAAPAGEEADGPTRFGIVAGSGPGDFRLVAEFGQAPGLPEGTFYKPLSGPFGGIPGMAINGAGQVAFGAYIFDGPGVDGTNSAALFAEDRAKRLHMIVRTGDVLDVDDGPGVDLRTVKLFGFMSNIAAGAQPHDGFNDDGYLAFSVVFTDGTAGVFVSSAATVAEPAADSIAAISLAILVGGVRCIPTFVRRSRA